MGELLEKERFCKSLISTDLCKGFPIEVERRMATALSTKIEVQVQISILKARWLKGEWP